MKAWDFTVTLPHTTGSLAQLGEQFGTAKINIEGLAIFEQGNDVIAHVLVENGEQARPVFEKGGYKVTSECEVIVEHVDNRPGVLGIYARQIADAGVNLTCAYIAMDGRLVLGAKDYSALALAVRQVVTAARS